MFIIPQNTVVHDSSLGIETFDAVFSILAYGVRIEFRLPAALRGELPSPIVPGAEFDERGPADAVLSVRVNDSAPGDPLYEISENGRVLGLETSLQAAACLVESWAQLTVATLAKGLVFVHAGVVGWRDRALVIPGRSLSGKSTLVLALVEAGAEYYSDEYALFDWEGRVHAYWGLPKLRVASGQEVASRLLGGVLSGSPPSPIPLGGVLLSRYEAESNWRPRRLSCGETLLGLLDNAVPLRLRPEESVKVLGRAMRNAQGYEGARGEAGKLAQQALALF